MAELAVECLLNKLQAWVVAEVDLLVGLSDEATEIRRELGSMRSFLQDADRRKSCDEGIREWVRQVREAAYDIEDALDEFVLRFGREHHGGIRAWLEWLREPERLIARHHLANKLQAIKNTVVSIKERQERYSFRRLQEATSAAGTPMCREAYFDEELDVVGFDQDVQTVVRLLTGESLELTPISLVSMGGSGKTTLARKIFKHQAIKSQFDCHAWVSVSQSFDAKKILVASIRGFYESRKEIFPNEIDQNDIRMVGQTLHSYLQNKRYILLLDDIWSPEVLEHINFALPNNQIGSRILITTRIDGIVYPIENRVGRSGFVHRLNPLPHRTAMDLFCKRAFRHEPQNACPQNLEVVCKALVEKCGGLPLALVVLGGIMSNKNRSENEWRRVLNTLSAHLRDDDHSFGRIREILSLSFEELPWRLKSCYLYCSVFPEDYLIKANRLIRLWAAEGLIEEKEGMALEEVGKQYVDKLIQRSLLQPISWKTGGLGVNACRMHDLLRELVVSKSKDHSFCTILTEQGATVSERVRRLSLHSGGQDGISLSNLRDPSHVRSLLIFGGVPRSFSTIFSGLRLTRVLDLEGASIEELPDALGNLFHLRYLNLRYTLIRRLPDTFGKLQNLQFLDIRRTPIESLPKDASNIKSLRYICTFPRRTYGYGLYQFVGCDMPSGVCTLRDLQKLSGVNATTEIVGSMGNLTKLKNLAIFKVRREHERELCESIANMKDLLTLRIAGISEEESLQLEFPSHSPRGLQDIQLFACLNELPRWISSLSSLSRLELSFSRLSQDPFSSLQSLLNLEHLVLHAAYDGKELCCSPRGFPKLKELFLTRLERLESIRLEETAMPSLQVLRIEECKEMKRVPRGFQHLATLRKLHLIGLPKEFVQQVPSIMDLTSIDGKIVWS